jgi:hypothetical protein
MSRRSSTSISDGAPARLPARWRAWCLAVLAATAIALATVLAVNALVDPFQQYRLASAHPPRFYRLHHRFINPGLAKNASYETVLIGSSIMESTRNDTIAAACGGPAVNLSMPAISASEIRALLAAVYLAHRPRRVAIVLDFNALAGAPDARQEDAGPLPSYLYDANVFNDLPYLLSGVVLKKSVSTLLDRADEPFTTDANAPWFWADRVTFGRAEVLRGLDLHDLNARFRQPARTLSGMRASFERNLLPVLEAHPATQFDLVWPPYSMLVWLDFAQRGQLEPTFAFKRYLAQAVARLSNVTIVDLQGHDEITGNLDLYRDPYHFAPQVNEWIVARTCAHLDVEDASNVGDYERRLRDALVAWRPPVEGSAAWTR